MTTDNLLSWCLQIAALIAASAAIAAIVPLRLPQARLFFWQTVLAGSLLLPALQPWQTPTVTVTSMGAYAVSSVGATAPSLQFSVEQAALLALACGTGLRLLWLAIGFARLSRWRRQAEPFNDAPGPADLLISDRVTGPVTFGWRRPVVLLPSGFRELPESSRDAILCHEFLHIERSDWLFTFAEELIRAAFWFHPAIWYAIGRIQLAREQTVDRTVIERTGSREDYLQALLTIAAARSQIDLAPAPLFLRKRHLAQRVVSIMKEATMSKRHLILSLAASSALATTAGVLAVRAFPLQAQTIAVPGGSLEEVATSAYPRQALERQVEGSVVLELKVDEKGRVADARVLSGPEELRNNALQSVLHWRYSTTQMQLPTTLQATIDYKLPDVTNPVAVQSESGLGALRRIDMSGLDTETQEAILRKIRLREGDSITIKSAGELSEVVRAVDKSLVVGISANNGVVFRISRGAPPAPPALPPWQKQVDQFESARAEGAGPGRIRVGGNVQDMRIISKAPPVYPPLAKVAAVEGAVTLSVIIGKDGAVQNITALSGHPLLVSSAMEAVRQWTYQPTLLNGEPVEVLTQVDVNYTLTK